MNKGLEIAANGFNPASILLTAKNSFHTWWGGIVGCVFFSTPIGHGFVENANHTDSRIAGPALKIAVESWAVERAPSSVGRPEHFHPPSPHLVACSSGRQSAQTSPSVRSIRSAREKLKNDPTHVGCYVSRVAADVSPLKHPLPRARFGTHARG